MTQTSQSIESTLHENRVFQPPAPEAVGTPRWLINSLDEYEAMYRMSIDDPESFWDGIAKGFDWTTPYAKVLEWSPPDAKWFIGGQTNVCHNCVDRQVETGHGNETAIIWEGEPAEGGEGGAPEIRRLTYADLQRDTARLANVLKSLGVRKGDVVTIYMGMVPELAVAMLACARMGAAHSIIFGGFSPHAIADRVTDAKSRVIVTCDGAWRRGKVVPLKQNVDEACDMLADRGEAGPEHVVVLRRCGNDINWTQGRDHDYTELSQGASDEFPPEPMDAEDMAFLLYTSGSTGKPKGILHTTAGYMVFTATTAKYVFNLIPGQNQTFWCTADIGWITGHSYIIYGILPNRVPTLMYEGAPNFPQEDRFWSIVERHKVTQFYTAPTAIRAFMKWGAEHPKKHDLSSLQVLGTVGEPINPEAWMWYRKHIGRDTCPIVDTWWQTETGGILITPLPGATDMKPGSATRPFFGIQPALVDNAGRVLDGAVEGNLVMTDSWPGQMRSVYGDHERFVQTYFSTYEGNYFTGDGARRDEDGYYWITGRVDDVLNVSGHRLGTAEIESALVAHPSVSEAAVVGYPHNIKGQGIYVYVSPMAGIVPSDELTKELVQWVRKEIGPIASPDLIQWTDGLPKTRSGKIMRRILRKIAANEHDSLGDTSTLADPSVVDDLIEQRLVK